MLERLAALDVAIFQTIHQAVWGTPWIPFLQLVQLAGAQGLVAFFAFGFLIAPAGRRVELTIRLIAPVMVAAAICESLKKLVNVERPKTLIPHLVLNEARELPRHFSWPSGHTTVVFAFATSVVFLRLFGGLPFRRWTGATIFAFAVATITGLARMAEGAHFPGDVLSGAILGVAAAHLVSRALDAVALRWPNRYVRVQ